MSLTSQKNPKLIVYINEFARYDSQGELLCRNRSCENYPKFPYKNIVRKNVIRTFDVGTITIFIGTVCDLIYLSVITIVVRFEETVSLAVEGEADLRDLQGWNATTLSKSLFKQLGYKFDTFENKVSATLDFLHNHNNLRTLCHSCHREVTYRYLASAHSSK